MKKSLILLSSIAFLQNNPQAFSDCSNCDYCDSQIVLSTARTCCESNGPYVTASYLFWYTKLEELPIVSEADLTFGSLNEIKEMDFRWESGFKLGVGYNLGGDQWDVFLNWTHLRPHADTTFHAGNGPNETLLAVLADAIKTGNEVVNVICRSAESDWHLNFNTVDFELGRNFFVGRDLSLRPFIGVKGGTFTQKLHVEYHDNVEFDVTTPNEGIPFDLTTLDFKENHDVIGPRMGIDTRWDFCQSNFAIVGDASFSLLWNWVRIHTLGTVVDLSNPDNDRHDVLKAKNRFMEPVFELFLGFDWRRCFNEKFALDLTAGYEMQLWLSENQILLGGTPGVPTERNLSFQGLTASIKLDF